MWNSKTVEVAIMETENERIIYRKANINDVETLVEYRVRFLNELVGFR